MAKPSDHQCANWRWRVSDDNGKTVRSTDHAILAVLMDIRAELRGLNATLDCHNFQNIPRELRQMNRRLRQAGLLVHPSRRPT